MIHYSLNASIAVEVLVREKIQERRARMNEINYEELEGKEFKCRLFDGRVIPLKIVAVDPEIGMTVYYVNPEDCPTFPQVREAVCLDLGGIKNKYLFTPKEYHQKIFDEIVNCILNNMIFEAKFIINTEKEYNISMRYEFNPDSCVFK